LISYLSVAQLEELHDMQLSNYGGGSGLQDREALEAAAARPAMTFGGEDLYPDIAAKAAALMHSLVRNHPFVEANERVGAHAALLFLSLNGAQYEITLKNIEELPLSVAGGEFDAESLAIWFRQRLQPRD
jgi:death-on-curing protein